ncbi:hypothetical protein JY96_15500 [Aquabacterium sp. NJ1]|uniref:DUF1501 domain-containing protein n=1 Tax=Aquabacterium sp. NJ1 TaxID=1538295 RepID=UPI00052DEF59|nr:DUF1501 domain-containing protein [Aquabacterium sp. NJ1]KGM42260.1 hypothetical protein JY96_15500 [Aquabacterium sp. NJ1]
MPTSISPGTRRLFLKQMAALAPLGAGAPLALNLAAASSAAAQTATDYKALVCIFLQGGNDAFNTVLATDASSWSRYGAARIQQPDSIALLKDAAPDLSAAAGTPRRLGGVLPLTPAMSLQGRSLALHPLLPYLQGLFNQQRKLAIVANVGPLLEPLTREQYKAGSKAIPSKLYSHNDQQSTWQALRPEGATMGWGGRMADMMAATDNSMFTAVSAWGNAVWLSGQNVRQYQVALDGAVSMGTTVDAAGQNRLYNVPALADAMARVVRGGRSSHVMEQDLAAVAARSMDAEKLLTAALPSAGARPFGPADLLNYTDIRGMVGQNTLAKQLQIVARCIGAQKALGLKRQVFFVNLWGFDTHNGQNQSHAGLMAQLNHAMAYFDGVITAMGMSDQVTTFTASDFGRSFTSNGDGTDHGWGGHHFVMGGAVRGGMVGGDIPVYGTRSASSYDFDNSPDQVQNGILLPSLAIEQYGATLGRWFGLSTSQLVEVFPRLPNFAADKIPNLLKA